MPLIDGALLYPPREPLRLDACAMDTPHAIREAAALLYQCGAVATQASVPWHIFHEGLMDYHPGNTGVGGAFPYPGVFVQTGGGWVFVSADARLNKGQVGWLRDAFTGDSVRIDFNR